MKDGKTCPACQGSGVETKLESFTVNIPKGVQDGSVIRVPGKGGVGPGGGARGDLYFQVHVEPHNVLRLRDGTDTELELPVAPGRPSSEAPSRCRRLTAPLKSEFRPTVRAAKPFV